MLSLLNGALLGLLTWLTMLVLIGLAGLPIASWVTEPSDRCLNGSVVRQSLWWGLAAATGLVLFVSFFGPLGNARSFTFVFAPMIILAGAGSITAIRRRKALVKSGKRNARRSLLLIALITLVMAYFAVAALGPPNNYDTGLYHLGAIQYAADFGIVPGLSNLYFPFGYANSQFALGGWLASTPWGLEGYRLLNGLLVLFALVDLGLRWSEKRPRPGVWMLTLGLTVAAFPLIAIADFWVTSPTSDSAVLLLTLVASAYLVDAVVDRSGADASVSIVVVTLAVAMRPTMLVFAGGVVTTLAIAGFRSRCFKDTWKGYVRGGIASGILALVIGGLQLARDWFLSGWLIYPLSALPLDVPWRSPDPLPFREATLAAARNPLAPDQYQVAHSWEWIGPWVTSRWMMWETYLLLALLLLGVLAWRLFRPYNERIVRKVLLSLWFPSALAIVAWLLFSPPSYRFAWGPLFVFGIAPLAAMLTAKQGPTGTSLHKSQWIVRTCSISVVSLIAITLTARTEFNSIDSARSWKIANLSIPYSVAPQSVVKTTSLNTDGGVAVQIPIEGDQCWATYPLCSPLPTPTLRFLGDDLESGFSW